MTIHSLRWSALAALIACGLVGATAAQPPKPTFEVASIKRNTSSTGGRLETLPDGTFRMINGPMIQLIFMLSPDFDPRDMIGLPDWVRNERYDVIAKPAAGAPANQQNERLGSLLAERMKFGAHVEEREKDTYTLTFARSDQRLGPQLKPSTIDCSPDGSGHFTPPGQRPGIEAFQHRCGVSRSPGWIVSGGTTIQRLTQTLRGHVGRIVVDHTGLRGDYAWSIKYAPPERAAAAEPADAPDIFTAVREQLGLRLQPERNTVPVLVIDHIERPTRD